MINELLLKAVQQFCDELCAHDLWNWGFTCQGIIRDVDYDAPAEITVTPLGKNIVAKMKDGRKIELCRTEGGWSIAWGDGGYPKACNHVFVSRPPHGYLFCKFCNVEKQEDINTDDLPFGGWMPNEADL